MLNYVGQQVGPYRILERLGQGGMASVYLARQPHSEREVAIKVLPLAASDEALAARFEREAKTLAGLRHPHILPVFDFGHAGEVMYFVMPVLRHGDLAKHLARKGGALPLGEVRRVLLQLCDALEHAHRAGVIHRDLKPGNVLIDAQGDYLLSDFGLAQLAGGSRLTAAGFAVGTPEYIAPEQGTGRPVDARTDVYALGVLAFQLSTGRLPFQADTAEAMVHKHEHEPPPSPRQLNPAIPSAFERALLKALAKSPEDRFASAAAFAVAIRQALPEGGEADAALPRPTAAAVGAATSRATLDAAATVAIRRQWPSLALAVGAIALGVVLLAVWVYGGYVTSPDSERAGSSSSPATPAAAAVAPKPAATPATLALEWRPGAPAVATAIEGGPDRWHLETREQAQGLQATFDGIPTLARVRVRLDTPIHARHATLGLTLRAHASAAGDPDWWVSCYLYANPGADAAVPTCTDASGLRFLHGATVAAGAAQELALRFDAVAQRVHASADSDALGELVPPPGLLDAPARWTVLLVAGSGDGQPVAGEFSAPRVDGVR
jgi:hypothetical protein